MTNELFGYFSSFKCECVYFDVPCKRVEILLLIQVELWRRCEVMTQLSLCHHNIFLLGNVAPFLPLPVMCHHHPVPDSQAGVLIPLECLLSLLFSSKKESHSKIIGCRFSILWILIIDLMTWPQDDLSDITYSVLQWCWWLLVPECVAFILNCRCFWFVVSQYEECTFVFSPCFPDTLYELYFTRLLLIGKHGVPFYIFRLAVKLHWSKI